MIWKMYVSSIVQSPDIYIPEYLVWVTKVDDANMIFKGHCQPLFVFPRIGNNVAINDEPNAEVRSSGVILRKADIEGV